MDGQDQVLAGVAASAADDVWALGSTVNSSTGHMVFHTLALHSTGGGFEIVPTPDRGGDDSVNNSFYGAAASSSDDVWAVGPTRTGLVFDSTTRIEHWDGKAWSIVDSPSPGVGNVLQTAAAVADDDAWAGGFTVDAHGGFRPLLMHWNAGISAVSSTSVWATAFCRVGEDPEGGYVLHWDGKAWAVVSRAPVPAEGSSELLGVDARSDHDVWVVGEYIHGSPAEETGLTLHYDGKNWSAPLAAPGSVRLAGVARGAGGTWSIGDQDVDPFVPPWSGHFGAGAWHQKPVRVDIGNLAAITADPDGHVWAVGSQDLGSSGPGSEGALVLTR